MLAAAASARGPLVSAAAACELSRRCPRSRLTLTALMVQATVHGGTGRWSGLWSLVPPVSGSRLVPRSL